MNKAQPVEFVRFRCEPYSANITVPTCRARFGASSSNPAFGLCTDCEVGKAHTAREPTPPDLLVHTPLVPADHVVRRQNGARGKGGTASRGELVPTDAMRARLLRPPPPLPDWANHDPGLLNSPSGPRDGGHVTPDDVEESVSQAPVSTPGAHVDSTAAAEPQEETSMSKTKTCAKLGCTNTFTPKGKRLYCDEHFVGAAEKAKRTSLMRHTKDTGPRTPTKSTTRSTSATPAPRTRTSSSSATTAAAAELLRSCGFEVVELAVPAGTAFLVKEG